MNGNHDHRPITRRGATILELLAVILIMLMITAMTIPVVAPAIAGRRLREGARMVSTFIHAARNRAIETGRPAGIWLERSRGLPEVCENLYMAEIPAPYGGDFLDSTVECVVVDQNGGEYDYDIVPGLRDYWNVVIPRSRTTFLTDAWSVADPSQQQLVREGDEIQIEGFDRRYKLRIINGLTINTPVVSGTNWWYILRGRNCSTSTGPLGAYTGDVHRNGRYVIRWFDGTQYISGGANLQGTVRSTDTPGNFDRPGFRYKIYRQPQRLQAGSMQLPETVVIDLNFSSMALNLDNPGIPFNPRNGGGLSYLGNSLYPNDDTPVVIVFSPNGNIERVYCHVRDTQGNWSWESCDAIGPAYLLVGDRTHVTPDQYDPSLTVNQNMQALLKKNWSNLDALWVRVTPNSGSVTTSMLDNLTTTDMAGTNMTTTNFYKTINNVRAAKAQKNTVVGGR